MSVSKVASVAALVGGLLWLAKVGLIWGNGGANTDGGLVAVCYVAGLVALAVAAAVAGYALVTTAPVWLRALVSVATLALAAILFSVVDSAAQAVYAGDGWLRDELGILVTAVLALLAGLLGLLRSRRSRPAQPVVEPGRRRLVR